VSWYPSDLLTDSDLLAYESTLDQAFNVDEWAEKRELAIQWVFSRLKANGFDPDKFRTRHEPDLVYGYTGSAYSDQTDEATDETSDDLNLATIFATPGTDALYIGSEKPFRGLSWRVLDTVSAVAGTVTVAYWGDAWMSLALDNQTNSGGIPFVKGGSMTWRQPSNWALRPLNSSDPLYWVKVTVSATPTAAKAGQLGCIRRSALCSVAALRTLVLLMREAPTGGDGPWREKANWYESQLDVELQVALQNVGGEFDTDDSDQISDDEADQTAEEAGGSGPFKMERA
jgi:hypothetical protein